MKILVVEDQIEKYENIKSALYNSLNLKLEFFHKETLRGSLRYIVQVTDIDLIILDMSMPNYENSSSNFDDSSPESFAGKELLEQLALRNINYPVIVLTQYSLFEGGSVSLNDLKKQFKDKYSFYVDSVSYSISTDLWKKELVKLIKDLL